MAFYHINRKINEKYYTNKFFMKKYYNLYTDF